MSMDEFQQPKFSNMVSNFKSNNSIAIAFCDLVGVRVVLLLRKISLNRNYDNECCTCCVRAEWVVLTVTSSLSFINGLVSSLSKRRTSSGICKINLDDANVRHKDVAAGVHREQVRLSQDFSNMLLRNFLYDSIAAQSRSLATTTQLPWKTVSTWRSGTLFPGTSAKFIRNRHNLDPSSEPNLRNQKTDRHALPAASERINASVRGGLQTSCRLCAAAFEYRRSPPTRS